MPTGPSRKKRRPTSSTGPVVTTASMPRGTKYRAWVSCCELEDARATAAENPVKRVSARWGSGCSRTPKGRLKPKMVSLRLKPKVGVAEVKPKIVVAPATAAAHHDQIGAGLGQRAGAYIRAVLRADVVEVAELGGAGAAADEGHPGRERDLQRDAESGEIPGDVVEVELARDAAVGVAVQSDVLVAGVDAHGRVRSRGEGGASQDRAEGRSRMDGQRHRQPDLHAFEGAVVDAEGERFTGIRDSADGRAEGDRPVGVRAMQREIERPA